MNQLPNVERIVGFRLQNARLKALENGKKKLYEISISTSTDENIAIQADIFIEATEYGDLLEVAGVPYSHYMETSKITGEISAPINEHPYVQDLTYVAIVEDYSPLDAPLVQKPDTYKPAEFDCMCAELCSDSSQSPVSCDEMLDYGRLPNNKFMINWPNFGNDHYADILEKVGLSVKKFSMRQEKPLFRGFITYKLKVDILILVLQKMNSLPKMA